MYLYFFDPYFFPSSKTNFEFKEESACFTGCFKGDMGEAR